MTARSAGFVLLAQRWRDICQVHDLPKPVASWEVGPKCLQHLNHWSTDISALTDHTDLQLTDHSVTQQHFFSYKVVSVFWCCNTIKELRWFQKWQGIRVCVPDQQNNSIFNRIRKSQKVNVQHLPKDNQRCCAGSGRKGRQVSTSQDKTICSLVLMPWC